MHKRPEYYLADRRQGVGYGIWQGVKRGRDGEDEAGVGAEGVRCGWWCLYFPVCSIKKHKLCSFYHAQHKSIVLPVQAGQTRDDFFRKGCRTKNNQRDGKKRCSLIRTLNLFCDVSSKGAVGKRMSCTIVHFLT